MITSCLCDFMRSHPLFDSVRANTMTSDISPHLFSRRNGNMVQIHVHTVVIPVHVYHSIMCGSRNYISFSTGK